MSRPAPTIAAGPVGLVQQALEQELASEIRRRVVVVWLDKEATYTAFVDELSARHQRGDFPYPVTAFRGSFLELLFQLEPHGSGLDNPQLLIHLPGHNEESVRRTPVLELYEPGFRFRKALDTLVRETAHGRVAPDEIERFLGSGPHTLGDADAWLARQLSSAREGLAGLLEQVGLTTVTESLFGHGNLFSRDLTTPELEVLQAYLHRQTGLDRTWFDFFGEEPGARPVANLAAAFAGWLLCVEYVHDLARPPHLAALQPLKSLSSQLVAACREQVQHLRERHPERYVTLADETELHLENEIASIRPEDLGQVDTFRREEACLLEAAIGALRTGEWEKARAWARAHTAESSFWLRQDKVRSFACFSPAIPSTCKARQAGLEPTTLGLEGRCSIRLSYWRVRASDFSMYFVLPNNRGERI